MAPPPIDQNVSSSLHMEPLPGTEGAEASELGDPGPCYGFRRKALYFLWGKCHQMSLGGTMPGWVSGGGGKKPAYDPCSPKSEFQGTRGIDMEHPYLVVVVYPANITFLESKK